MSDEQEDREVVDGAQRVCPGPDDVVGAAGWSVGGGTHRGLRLPQRAGRRGDEVAGLRCCSGQRWGGRWRAPSARRRAWSFGATTAAVHWPRRCSDGEAVGAWSRRSRPWGDPPGMPLPSARSRRCRSSACGVRSSTTSPACRPRSTRGGRAATRSAPHHALRWRNRSSDLKDRAPSMAKTATLPEPRVAVSGASCAAGGRTPPGGPLAQPTISRHRAPDPPPAHSTPGTRSPAAVHAGKRRKRSWVTNGSGESATARSAAAWAASG